MLLGKLDAAGRQGDFQPVDGQAVAIGLGEIDALVVFVALVGHQDRGPEGGDAKQRRAPVGYAVNIVDEPAQGRVHLVEGTNRHHQAAKAQIAVEIDRGCNDDGGNDRQPPIAGGHPCQPRQRHHQPVADFQNRGEIALETALFIAFSGRQRHRLDMLIDPHQREAQGSFPRIMVAIDLDERAANEPADGRRSPGVKEGRPDHIAGNVEIVAADVKDEAGRERPQNADETGEQNARLEQADGQARRQIGEMACVFMHALVGIDADGTGIGKAKGARRLHPFADQIKRQAFPQFDPDPLIEPGLQHVENQKRPAIWPKVMNCRRNAERSRRSSVS